MPDWGESIRGKPVKDRADALIAHAGQVTVQSWSGRSWTEVMRFASRWVTDFALTHGTKMAVGALAGFGIGQVAGAAMSGGSTAIDYLSGQSPELLRKLGNSAVQQAYSAWYSAPGLPEFLKKLGDDYGSDMVETVQEHFADEFINDSTKETLDKMLTAGVEGYSENLGVLAEVRQSLVDYWYRQRLKGGVDFAQKVTSIMEAISAAGKLHAQVKEGLDHPDRLRYCDDVVALADGINQMIALRSDAMAQIFLLENFLSAVKKHFRRSDYKRFSYDKFDGELSQREQQIADTFAGDSNLVKALNVRLRSVTEQFLSRTDVSHKVHSRVNVFKAVQSCSKQHCFGPKGTDWF